MKVIPQNVLIDPQGKVTTKDLRGEDVNKKNAAFINKLLMNGKACCNKIVTGLWCFKPGTLLPIK